MTAVMENRTTSRPQRTPERMFEVLCEESLDLIAVIDSGYRIRYENRAVTTLLGYDEEERLGRSALELLHPDDLPRVAATLEACFSGDRPDGVLEYRCRHKDGSWRTFEGIGRVSFELGEPLGLIHSRDVTDRRNLERQVLQAQQYEIAGRATAAFAHDINNLLTAVVGHIEILADARDTGATRATREHLLSACARVGSYARRLVQQVRPHPETLPRRCDAHAVLAELTQLIQPLLGRDVLLHLALGAEQPSIALDQICLEQIVMNLVVNARDAMPAGGTLTITTRSVRALGDGASNPGGHFVLEVADTGTGMTEDVRARIFEPFFTTKDGDTGSGLGLATVAGIVSHAAGTIEVESTIGRGTTFLVCLPLAEAHDRAL
jgi:PAS domain S-box-containing protein